MLPFDPSEWADMEAEEREFMPHQCQFTRATSTSDAGGGYTEEWLPYGDVFPCSVDVAASSQERQLAAQIGVPELLRVRVPNGIEASATDRIVVIDLDQTLEIQHAPTASDYETARDLYAVWG